MFVQLETLTTLGKVSIPTYKNSTPGSNTTKPSFRACKHILSPPRMLFLPNRSVARLQSWALFAEISGAESLGEIGAGA